MREKKFKTTNIKKKIWKTNQKKLSRYIKNLEKVYKKRCVELKIIKHIKNKIYI